MSNLGTDILDDGSAFRKSSDDDQKRIRRLKTQWHIQQNHIDSGRNALALLLFFSFCVVFVSFFANAQPEVVYSGLGTLAIVGFLLFYSRINPKISFIIITILYSLLTLLTLIMAPSITILIRFIFIYFFVRAILAGAEVENIKQEIRNIDEDEPLELQSYSSTKHKR